MEKKEISSKAAVKAVITGFASYGIIILFIYKIIAMFINKSILQDFSIDKHLLYVTLATIYSIVTLVTMHLLCRLSTYDVLKKCTIKKEDVDKVSKTLGKIFITCVFISIILSFVYLYLTLMYESKIQAQSIILTNLQSQNIYSKEFTNTLVNKITSDFYTYRTNLITYTFILELGFCVSLIAIVPFQKKMLEKYNT